MVTTYLLAMAAGSIALIVGALALGHVQGQLPGQLFFEERPGEVPASARPARHRRSIVWREQLEAALALLVIALDVLLSGWAELAHAYRWRGAL